MRETSLSKLQNQVIKLKEDKKHKLERFKDNEITDTFTYEIANPICKECGGKLKLIGKRYKDYFDIEIRLVKRRIWK